MLIDEHKAILTELMSPQIEPTRKTELLMKLGDDYGITQADLNTKATTLETTTKERDYYSGLSQKLWLENSVALTEIEKGNVTPKQKTEIEHQAKRSYNDLMSKF